MLTDIFKNTNVLDRLYHRSGGAYLDDYTDWLAERHYQNSTIISYVYAADRFLTWMQEEGYKIKESAQATLADYKSHLAITSSSDLRYERSNSYCGARRFLLFFQETGLTPLPNDEIPPLISVFCEWMRTFRDVKNSTLNTYTRTIHHLLNTLGNEPSNYTAEGLRTFVLQQTSDFGVSHTETVVTATRMFIRFLIATKRCTYELQYSIPRVSGWRLSSLPNYLSEKEIEQIINHGDPSTTQGARDQAIILLLARLALRGCDVSALKITDIDWNMGRIRISGKVRHADWLPLPQEVGDAILYYLKQARPKVNQQAVFLIMHAPYTAIQSRQVSQIAARAISRAGIKVNGGAYLFRHSLATIMLRKGVSLQNIGVLLRHKSADTTLIYAKVDVENLRLIAQPWLGGELC